jgi:hypothetical protein
MQNNPITSVSTTRRQFLRSSVALAGAGAVSPLALERSVHAAGRDVIRVGLIGCGGRGTEAAVNAMNAGKDIRLVARLTSSEERLKACREQPRRARPDQVS